MRIHAEKHSCLANWQNQAHQFMVCENLCKRLLADEYIDYSHYKSPKTEQEWWRARQTWKHEELMQKQDKALLFSTMFKHIDSWWD